MVYKYKNKWERKAHREYMKLKLEQERLEKEQLEKEQLEKEQLQQKRLEQKEQLEASKITKNIYQCYIYKVVKIL